jgi:hypothetical protein
MRTDGQLAVYYAPFEYVNPQARLVLVGITPGRQQAVNALLAYRSALASGHTCEAALALAKDEASFSGPMRSNLVGLLDYLGVQRWLGLESCASLFQADTGLVHFTSALRYPIFANGQNYSGRSPGITRHALLRSELEHWLPEELAPMDAPLVVPLGGAVEQALDFLADRGRIEHVQLLRGLPHPSGANAERLSYFMERKSRAACSDKVNTAKLDRARAEARRTVDRL